jgi:aryl-alcohol dehydrogenase-like predicted oxidoreductase
VRYRTLGDSTSVSVLCLGTMMFGTTIDEPTSFALLDQFVARGGTFLDTADCYAFWRPDADGGESERLLGRWLAARDCRGEVVLASKVGALPAGPGEWPANREGLSAAAIDAAVRGSLKRLGTDRLDLLYGHVDDPSVPLADVVGVFAAVVTDGLAGQVAMSNQNVHRFRRARELAAGAGLPGFVALQQRHSYLPPAPGTDFGVQVALDDPMLDYARSQPDLTLLAYSTLLDGAYTNPAKPVPDTHRQPGVDAALRELREVAREAGATPNQVVYAWLLGGEPAVIPLVGVSSLTQLAEALDAVDLALTESQRARLDTARAALVAGTPT